MAYRSISRNLLARRRYLIGMLLFIFCIVEGILLVKIFTPLTGPIVVPLPTGMDSNFVNQVDKCFIPTAAAYGYTLRITAGFRSLQDQAVMYTQGRSVNGHIVTDAPASRSIHNYGFAVDVVDRWRGYNIDWVKLGQIGLYCGLEQGSDGDSPHFEHRAGLTTPDFVAGKRPPLLTLPCAVMDERSAANKPLTLLDLKSCGAPKF